MAARKSAASAVTLSCDSCQLMRINGLVCHEIGCPDAWRYYTIECLFCGQEFVPAERYQRCCDESCYLAYHGL